MANDISNLLGRFGANANGYLEVEHEIEYKELPKAPAVKPVAVAVVPANARESVNEAEETPAVSPAEDALPSVVAVAAGAPALADSPVVGERIEPVIEDLPELVKATTAAAVAPAALAGPVTPAAQATEAALAAPAAPAMQTAPAAAPAMPAVTASVHPIPSSLRSLLSEAALEREARARDEEAAHQVPINAVPTVTPAQVIAVVSPKGGVGKTTISAALAVALNPKGRVVAIDLDPQNALQYHLGAAHQSDAGLVAASWSAALRDGATGTRVLPHGVLSEEERRALEQRMAGDSHWLAGQLARMNLHADDVVILDTPAGRTPYLEQALAAADQVAVVLTPDAGSFMALDHLASIFDERENCGFIVNQFDASRTFSQDMLAVLKRRFGARLIGVVSLDHAIGEALAYGHTLAGNEQLPLWQEMRAIGVALTPDAKATVRAGGCA
ncbi:MAG: hypothetical protein GAK35_00778 [Herbaspirillum frisingense]|uniref:AAA+ ATPase domain-containing protein n=1 Tax=Herbaspirillum frisingense TaxID=92645 RepID=A0A7V8FZ91_9BURK|nr:MAG: hypothetical protein GAK35_00778 [Herbaspirillum frisingense]